MSRTQRCQAFTLVEVILAILIISGIMTVLLFFYHRTVEVRQTVLRESEFLSVSRMVLEQITGELRSARVVPDQFAGFEGNSNTIMFVCTSLPEIARWILNTNEAVALAPSTDLKRITYRLLSGTNIAEIRGIDRVEELLTGSIWASVSNAVERGSNPGADMSEFTTTNALPDPEFEQHLTNELALIRQPLTALIKHLQFRYWAGTNWVDSWSGLELPGGVEISLARDPIPPETLGSAEGLEEPHSEIFRRVVFLPNSIPRANRSAAGQPLETFENYFP